MKRLGFVDVSIGNTIREQLFKRPFLVKMKQMDLLTKEEISTYGYVSSSDESEDIKAGHEIVSVYKKIPELVKLFKERTPFYFGYQAEEDIVYNLIYNHIKEWKDYAVNNRFNSKIIPYEDLKDMSLFANSIYRIRDRVKEEQINKCLYDIGNNLSVFEANTLQFNPFLKKEEKPEVKVEKEEARAPHLEDISVLEEIFSKRS